MNDDNNNLIMYAGMTLVALSVISIIAFGMYSVGKSQAQRQSTYEQAEKITTKQKFDQALKQNGKIIAVSTKISGDPITDPNLPDQKILYVKQTHDETYTTIIPVSTGKTTTMIPTTNTDTVTDYQHHGKYLQIFGHKFSYDDIDYERLIQNTDSANSNDYHVIKDNENVSFIAKVHDGSLESVDGSPQIKIYDMNQDRFAKFMND